MTKRIFIAVDISDEARSKSAVYLEKLRKDFRDLRVGWEQAEKLHLTLKFLGDLDEQQLAKIKEAVRETARHFAKFTISLQNTGVFPNPKNARVLWIGLDDEPDNLLKIFEMLETECQNSGFPKETKKFHPHLTIARLREPNKSRKLVERHLAEKFERIEFEVSQIVIYESQLLPTGSKFYKLAKSEFTGIKEMEGDNC